MALASGHHPEVLEGEENEKLTGHWKGIAGGLVRLSPGGWVYPVDYLKLADKFYNFKFKPSDVVVMTWPKCGTTWMQEIVWMMRNSPDLKNPDQDKSINSRVPFLECDMFLGSSLLPPPDPESSMAKEFSRLCPDKSPKDGVFLQLSDAMPEPRTIKTHFPISLFSPSLLEGTKVVYVARHPKDVVVSYDHHCRLFKSMSFVGEFEDFVNYFTEDALIYGPYWLHLKEAWEARNHENVHFVFYEDMKTDTTRELQKLNDFLGTNLSNEQIENIRHYTSFDEMRLRDNVFSDANESESFTHEKYKDKHGGFFRKGQNGGWKSKLSAEQSQKIDSWTQKNLTPLNIPFVQK